MTKLTFLGGCREVGRSAILIESNNGAKCILDYGVRFTKDNRLPYETDISNLKAIALTHCHIDHSGGLPYLYKDINVPLLTNSLTLRISEILLKDMIKISNYPYPFGFRELEKLRRNSYFLDNGNRHKIDDKFYITFYDAGHIPGSVSILVEIDEKRILYTGDINSINTNLTIPANPSIIPAIDTLIIESTYALREHPPREDLERNFMEKIIDINENGGNILIPAFGVARSQEVLLILNKYNYKGRVYIDGLARKIATTYSEFPEFFRNYKNLKTALRRAQFVSRASRKKISKNSNSVIISPSGMLKGGAALNYIQMILNDSNSALYLVGYQVEGTPGRKLLDEGIFEYTEKSKKRYPNYNLLIKANCDINYYDFSSHSDRKHLYKYIDQIKFHNNSNLIFCIHGDDKATTTFSKDLANRALNSVAPEIGETYKI